MILPMILWYHYLTIVHCHGVHVHICSLVYTKKAVRVITCSNYKDHIDPKTIIYSKFIGWKFYYYLIYLNLLQQFNTFKPYLSVDHLWIQKSRISNSKNPSRIYTGMFAFNLPTTINSSFNLILDKIYTHIRFMV